MNELLKDHIFWRFVIGKTSVFEKHKGVLYDGIKTIMSFLYPILFVPIFIHLFNINALASSKLVEPLWPVFFLEQAHLLAVSYILQISLILSVLVVTIKNTQFMRIYVFLNYFLFAALISSFGKINHGLHFLLIPLFCFALIPNEGRKHFKEKTILMYLSAKFFLLVAYSLTGFWKLFWGIIEYFTEQVSLFSPLSFRNILIAQFELKPVTFLGEWLIEHYIIGWILYIVVIYLELFSIAIFFKPNLYKIWGLAIIAMHAGLALVMDVNNYVAVLVLVFLLVLSPFNKSTSIKDTIKSLPILDGFAYFRSRKRF
ncbi:MAG: hypothetical protein GYB32_04570 [Algicola sp.]|nr:hypothetical protein [Algicola sp.]